MKNCVRWIIGIALGLYIGILILLNLSFVQQRTSMWVSQELSRLFHSQVTIGCIDLGLLNRLILEDFQLYDQSGQSLLQVPRLSVKWEWLPLLKGKISINSAQLLGCQLQLSKETPEAAPNYQFVLDALQSDGSKSSSSFIDLRVNSLIIRRGRVAYDLLSEPSTPDRWNPNHLHFNNIQANISLKALQKDSLNTSIKRLHIEEEHSGLQLKRLQMKLIATPRYIHLEHFDLGLRQTSLQISSLRLDYDSLATFSQPHPQARLSCQLQSSQLVLSDLSPFVPLFDTFHDPLTLEMSAQGTMDTLRCRTFSLKSDRHFDLQGHLDIYHAANAEARSLKATLTRLYADPQGIEFLTRNLMHPYQAVPPYLQHLGTVDFRGDLSGRANNLSATGLIRTDLGDIKTRMHLTTDQERGLTSLTGHVKTNEFSLGKLLGDPKFDKVTLDLQLQNRSQRDARYPFLTAKGVVASFDYSGYRYEQIALDGEYRNGGFNGQVSLDDENGSVLLHGSINLASRIPTFNFGARIDHLRPHTLKLSPHYEDGAFSVRLRADFTGGNIDEMRGDIHIDSLSYDSPEEHYRLQHFQLSSNPVSERQKQLLIRSDFMQGKIEGDYSYRTLPTSLLNILRPYLPAVIPPPTKEIATTNDFSFDIHLFDNRFFQTVLRFPLRVYTHSTLKGYVNDRLQRVRIEGYFPRFQYADRFIESAMLICENPDQRFRLQARLNERKEEGTLSLAAEALAYEDQIKTTLNWGNSSQATFSGRLDATTHFQREWKHRQPQPPLKTTVRVAPSDIILNDTLWQIHPSEVVIDSGRVHIHDFCFSHAERHLKAHGTLSDDLSDTIRLELNRINLRYVFDMADLGVDFRGEATGPAYACGVLKEPVMRTDLHVLRFGMNDGVFGDADIHGEWHHDVKGIHLQADICEPDSSLHTYVQGYVYPLKPTSALDLHIQANQTNLRFLHYFLEDLTSDFRGYATGNVHLYGKFKALTLQGQVDADADFKFDILNTTYHIKDSIYLQPEGITFRHNRVFDNRGHQATLNGQVRYEHFKHIDYRFQFDLQNFLVLDTHESPDFPFYGTVFGTGNAVISGNEQEGLNINLAVSTNRGSVFTYIKDNITSATSNQFIRFVDKTPRRSVQDSVSISDFEIARHKAEEEHSEEGDIRLNLLVDVTPEATLKMIMDPLAGDYISGRGSGNIRTEFYNKGDVRMFGSYRINQGVYKFSLQEIIRKDFSILDGSTLTFSGAPEEAMMDIRAGYMVNSASLNDLIPKASDYVSQTNVKVNCLMNLSGPLTSPDIKMSLELPNELDEVQALVRNYIPTDEQMNMQILYLLSIGKFYTPEYVDGVQNSNMMSSVLSSTLSGQLNNALSQIIDSNNWNFGTNFSTGEKGWTDVEFEGMLSGQLLNNRLLINGNFGYRDNPMANTNFVGDFEAEWLLTRSGDIRLKAYNETNDRYYTKTNLTTQGIGVIFKRDFNRWSDLFFWRKWWPERLKSRSQEQTAESPAAPRAAEKRE